MVATALLGITILANVANLARSSIGAASVLSVLMLVAAVAYLWWLRRQEHRLLAEAERGTVFASRSYIDSFDLSAHDRFAGVLNDLRRPRWGGVSGRLEVGPYGVRFRPNPRSASSVIEIPWTEVRQVELTRNPLSGFRPVSVSCCTTARSFRCWRRARPGSVGRSKVCLRPPEPLPCPPGCSPTFSGAESETFAKMASNFYPGQGDLAEIQNALSDPE